MRSSDVKKRAVVIGDGPAALASAIILIKCGYNVTVVGERNGIYTRTQILRFAASDFGEYSEHFFGTELDDTTSSSDIATLTSQRIATLKNKAFTRPPALHATTSEERRYANFNNSDRSGFFEYEDDYITIKIKHIEQALFEYLRQLEKEADNSCNFIFKKRKNTLNADGTSKKDLGAIASIYPDGTIELIDDLANRHLIKPDILIVADGMASASSGVLAEINRVQTEEASKFHFSPHDGFYRKTLNPTHTTGIYNVRNIALPGAGVTAHHILELLLGNIDSHEASELEATLEIPTSKELRDFGWPHHAVPEWRILRGKNNTLYIATETPSSLLAITDSAERSERLERWHHLILRYRLPKSLIELAGCLFRKTNKKNQLNLTSFSVKIEEGQHLDKLASTLGDTMVIPMGDAALPVTHYQSATGLDACFKCLLRLMQLLGRTSIDVDRVVFIKEYLAGIREIIAIKRHSTRQLQQNRIDAERNERETNARELNGLLRVYAEPEDATTDRADLLKRILAIVDHDPALCLVMDISVGDSAGRTAFDKAIILGIEPIVMTVLNRLKAVDVFGPYSYDHNNRRFALAIKSNMISPDTLKRLMLSNDAVNTPLEDGLIPMMHAARNGNEAVMRFLLNHNANLTTWSSGRVTAEDHAIEQGTLNIYHRVCLSYLRDECKKFADKGKSPSSLFSPMRCNEGLITRLLLRAANDDSLSYEQLQEVLMLCYLECFDIISDSEDEAEEEKPTLGGNTARLAKLADKFTVYGETLASTSFAGLVKKYNITTDDADVKNPIHTSPRYN
ncbi:MAG: ankyrin repeat domain-containing protein [Coxiellaceae bacterium]|nr:ankyrin repeat domain-containing protein [Coxiellaceae bacterium]